MEYDHSVELLPQTDSNRESEKIIRTSRIFQRRAIIFSPQPPMISPRTARKEMDIRALIKSHAKAELRETEDDSLVDLRELRAFA